MYSEQSAAGHSSRDGAAAFLIIIQRQMKETRENDSTIKH